MGCSIGSIKADSNISSFAIHNVYPATGGKYNVRVFSLRHCAHNTRFIRERIHFLHAIRQLLALSDDTSKAANEEVQSRYGEEYLEAADDQHGKRKEKGEDIVGILKYCYDAVLRLVFTQFSLVT
jgi:hypothetical protein